jgi:hypothetical protein
LPEELATALVIAVNATTKLSTFVAEETPLAASITIAAYRMQKISTQNKKSCCNNHYEITFSTFFVFGQPAPKD